MKGLKVGVSGIRGIVDEALSPETVLNFCLSFGTIMNKGKVIVSRDTRISGYMYKNIVKAALLSTGCSCVDLDVCPTPTTQIMVKELKADGAVIITASHNPIQYNGLKFVNKDGLFLNARERENLLELYKSKSFAQVNPKEMKTSVCDNSAVERHMKKVFKLIKPDAIRKRKFKVAYDCCGGAGSVVTPLLMKKLGVKPTALNDKPNGFFPHTPEPVPKNLTQICLAVKKNKCDVGFAQDPDADRLAIIDETGRAIGEEYTLALAVRFILKKNPKSTIVTNLSTTRAIDDIAAKYQAKVVRTAVGEMNVVEQILKKKAIIGGEGNGGVIWPAIHPCRDSIAAMMIVLDCMAREKKKLSEILAEIPQYKIIKHSVACSFEDAQMVARELKERYSLEKINTIDGIKIDLKEGWVHVRPSNTEPIMRIIAEAKDEVEAQKLIGKISKDIEEIIKAAEMAH
ncbi:MAG: phosphoglucosamine mutase [Candidatus Omnitrophota bacterium]